MPIANSVAMSPETSARDAPSASCRAAWIPCVSGMRFEIHCIHSGSSVTATFAPVKISRRPKSTLFSTAVSRTRNPIAAQIRPRPVHANAETAIARAIDGHVEGGMWIPRIRLVTTSENAATNIALTTKGNKQSVVIKSDSVFRVTSISLTRS